MKWLTGQGSITMPSGRVDQVEPPAAPGPIAGPTEYMPLQKYLTDRYANTVVLRLSEIEDLLGFTLPDLARVQAGWWANPDAEHPASVQSRSWTSASRTATPHLLARTVVFERALA